jgi:hypothetical protein
MLTRVNKIHPATAGYCLKQLSMVPGVKPLAQHPSVPTPQISGLRKVAHRSARGWKQTDIIKMPRWGRAVDFEIGIGARPLA